MNTFTARLLVIALVAAFGSGCASSLSAKTPKFRDRDLRPMNQDLAAWLERLNAGPTVAGAPDARPTVARDPTVDPRRTTPALQRLPEARAVVSTTLPPSNAVPSPAASTPTATASPPPPPVPVAAVAAVALTSPDQAQSAASAPAATSPSPGVSQPPASPTQIPDAPNIALAAEPGESKHSPALGSVVTSAASVSVKSVAVAPLPPPLPPPQPTWTAFNGTTLRGSVEEWSAKAEWTVVWDAGVDYPISGSLKYEGTYLDAIRGIFFAHAGAERPLRADLYTSQKLIHITE